MNLMPASSTHPGRRKYNQDTVIVTEVESPAGSLRLVAVLDGMGGMRAGDRASQLAREVFEESIVNGLAEHTPTESYLRELLVAACNRAHHTVYDEGQNDPEKKGMGTTLVAVVEKDGKFLVLNVGDSRAYLWTPENDDLSRLTRDHSLVEEAVRMGRLSQEEAERSPYAHALTRAVGSGPTPQPDLYPESDGWFDFPAGGMLLLCSDGLTGGLGDDDIRHYVAGCADPIRVAECLTRAAYHGGSTDNISTVILAHEDYHAVGPQVEMPPPIELDAPKPTSKSSEVLTPPETDAVPDKAAPLWLKIIVVLLIGGLFVLIFWRFSARVDMGTTVEPPPAPTPALQAPDAPPSPQTLPAQDLPAEPNPPAESNDPAPAPAPSESPFAPAPTD
ncbi:MAG: protein phosphatase 2C domain-containing protein [Candidatus Lernaella stagnicola]|nr:protein phosphatase 2C domain-containing protein [Candidatus Lernaella stagnicola]